MSEYFWIARGSEKRGPYTLEQLKQMWGQGAITADSLFLKQGTTQWQPILSLQELTSPVSPKAISVALAFCILSFLLGGIGFHAFYAGRWKQGIAYIAFPSLGICGFYFISLVFKDVEFPFAELENPLSVYILFTLTLIMLILPRFMALADLFWILTGNYRDGKGQKIRKWSLV